MSKLNIVPFENDDRYENNNVFIDKVSITYGQSSDSSGDDGDEEVQEITLTARNNGTARFINIKTESWSIQNLDELKQIIDDFEQRAKLI